MPSCLCALAAASASKAESASYVAGQWVGVILLTILPIWFLQKAMRSEQRSLRFANLALFFGLLMLFQPRLPLGLTPSTHGLYYGITGVLRVLLGLTGIVCAVLALRQHGKDQGTGVARPILGGLFCGVHCLYGVSLALSIWLFSLHSGEPWTFVSPDKQFRLSLPGEQWQLLPAASGSGWAAKAQHQRRGRVGQVGVRR